MLDRYLKIIQACRRSRVKLRVYRALDELEVATVPELADAAQTTADRVLAVLHGDGEDYRAVSSLVALGVAAPRSSARAYAMTRFGREAWRAVRPRLQRGRRAR